MNLSHFILLLCVIVVWGLNYIAIKIGLEGLPPIFLCFARFLFCLPALFLIKRPQVPFHQLATYSLVMFVLQFSLLFTAMRSGITAGLASVILQFQSFFSIAFGVLFMGEKYHFSQGIGALVAFLGMVLVALHVGGEITPSGLFLVLIAAIMWAAGSVISKKIKSNGLSLVVWSSLIAAPLLLILSFLLEGRAAIEVACRNFSWFQFGIISYVAFFSTLFGFGIWNWLLQRYPLSKLAPFTLLVPIVGMLSSAIFLGEEIYWWKAAAAGLVIGGVGLNLIGSKSQAQPVAARESGEKMNI